MASSSTLLGTAVAAAEDDGFSCTAAGSSNAGHSLDGFWWEVAGSGGFPKQWISIAKRELRRCYYCSSLKSTIQAVLSHEKECRRKIRGQVRSSFESARERMPECWVNCVVSCRLCTECDENVGSSIRVIEKMELLEILEAPMLNKESRLARVRARALLDSATGWVTMKSNESWFLAVASKPFLRCKAPRTLFDAHHDKLRTVMPDEMLEFIEGPHQKLRGIAGPSLSYKLGFKVRGIQDGIVGWIWALEPGDIIPRRAHRFETMYPELIGLEEAASDDLFSNMLGPPAVAELMRMKKEGFRAANHPIKHFTLPSLGHGFADAGGANCRNNRFEVLDRLAHIKAGLSVGQKEDWAWFKSSWEQAMLHEHGEDWPMIFSGWVQDVLNDERGHAFSLFVHSETARVFLSARIVLIQ